MLTLPTFLVFKSGKVSNATNIENVYTKTELYTFTPAETKKKKIQNKNGSGKVQQIIYPGQM